ncbi:cation:proton antiporter [Natronolimnobius sp. AArcel1]|uniref:cation:proton antiporter domain-containing protein n=1 Tax=Natronolimnobius sp. AArcel1 TaxID=1679093 RepID=UPI0013EDB97F|nr:cation:proton antiporter [Natronolimnobius sp. AArcel1]
MTDIQIFFAVGIALTAALFLGELVGRAGEPVILGEILAGVALGAYALEIVDPEGSFALLAAIGSMLLLFDAGYEEIDVQQLERGGLPVLIIALFGVGLPAVGGLATGLIFGYPMITSLILAITLGVTSIGVTARTLLDLDQLDTEYGLHVVGAAVTAEILGLVVFSLLMATQQTGASTGQIVRILGLVVAFFVGAFLVQWLLIDRISRLLAGSRQTGADMIGIMGLLFLFGYAAAAVGLDVIVGGLVAGLIVSSERRFRETEIREGIVGIAYGVFIPLFFVNVGAQMDPTVLLQFDQLVIAVVAVGVVVKVGGSYLGARLAGHPHEEALIVGVGMLPRAGVELVVATTALAAGLIDERLFSAVLALVLVSVLATPLLLKRAIRRTAA